MAEPGFFPIETDGVPGWVYVAAAGLLVGIFIFTEETRPGTLSGEHCRDSEGKFVPVPQCTRKRRKRT